MSEKTNISCVDHTFNIAWGCAKVSPACMNCYAERLSKRYGFQVWGSNADRRTFGENHWREPLKWNAKAEKDGVRRRVLCSSMCDVFEDHPTIDQEREKLWQLIRRTPQLDWQLLTKCAERIRGCLPDDWGEGYPNVWLGITTEDQGWANQRIPYLMQCPAAVRFIVAEPLLGVINLETPLVGTSDHSPWIEGIDWVVVGGESGSGFRPLNLEAVRTLQQQCERWGTAFFFKQVGGLRPGSNGDQLDGVQYHQMPKTRELV
jgi:protein gp37